MNKRNSSSFILWSDFSIVEYVLDFIKSLLENLLCLFNNLEFLIFLSKLLVFHPNLLIQILDLTRLLIDHLILFFKESFHSVEFTLRDCVLGLICIFGKYLLFL